MSYLDKALHFDHFVAWGAAAQLRVSEAELRQAHFGNGDQVTVGHIIDALVRHPGHIVWSLARREVLDELTLHGLGSTLLTAFLARLRQEGTYIDFRTQRLSDVKHRLAQGEASLGELAAARVHAKQAWHDVALLGDAKVSAAATAAVAAAAPDLRNGILEAARVMYSTHTKPSDFVQLASLIRCFLATRAPKKRTP